MSKQCPSCGGDCGYTKRDGCQQSAVRNHPGVQGLAQLGRNALVETERLRSAYNGAVNDRVELEAGMARIERELAEARAEVEKLTSCGLIECAVRNPAVSEAMRHWENRAEKAEAEVERLRGVMAHAYGHLWHTNDEPLAPIPLRSYETACYAARKCLSSELTKPERGAGIQSVGILLSRYEAAPNASPQVPGAAMPGADGSTVATPDGGAPNPPTV